MQFVRFFFVINALHYAVRYTVTCGAVRCGYVILWVILV